MKTYLILFIILFFSPISFGGEGSWSKRYSLSDLSVYQDYDIYNQYRIGQDVRDYSAHTGMVFLEYTRKQQTDLQTYAPWRVTVQFTYLNANNTQEQRELQITYDQGGKNVYTDYEKLLISSSNTGYEITVTDIKAEYLSSSGWNITSPTSDYIPIDIDFRLELRNELIYELGVEAPNLEMTDLRFDPTTFRANWKYIEGAEEYDFEWVFIDRYSKEYTDMMVVFSDPGQLENGGYSLPFELKESSRVRLKGTHYVIDKTFPTGRLFFRVRAVSTFAGSTGITDDIKTGEWTYFESPSQYLNGGTISLNNIVYHDVVIDNAFENEKNWLYGVAYAENGKSVSSVSFYDGSNRARQNMTYNTSDNVTLVGESKFDFEGRQTISVIPAPVMGRKLGYHANFNLAFTTGTDETNAFDEEDFDIPNPEPLYSPVSGESGAAQYFSENNQFNEDLFRAAIPDANGYVYSQTIYRNDGSGRIESVGGIGQTFQANGVHAVKTYYGSPTETELKRLFGNNVADSPEGYRKDLVEDANGQHSVTYYDKRGHVIATALSGDAPDNLLELEGADVMTYTTPLNDNNVPIGMLGLQSEHTFLNTIEDNVIGFTYNFEGAVNQINSQDISIGGKTISVGSLCSTCRYDLTIEITDPAGNPMGNSPYHYPITPSFTTDFCSEFSTAVVYTMPPIAGLIFHDLGEYRIVKTLQVDVESMQAAFDAEIESMAWNNPEAFIANYLGSVDLTSCFDNCEDYCAEQWRMDYMLQGHTRLQATMAWNALSKPEKDAAIQNCLQEDCNYLDDFSDIDGSMLPQGEGGNANSHLCETLKQSMKEQLSPGGIYFTDALSQAHDANVLLGGNDANSYANLTATNQEGWESSFAETLLPYHRENCHLETCETWSSSMNYSMKLALAMQNAGWNPTSAMYLQPYNTDVTMQSPSGIQTEDPFIGSVFNQGVSTTFQTRVSTYLTSNPLGSPCSGSSGSLVDYVEAYVSCLLANSTEPLTVSADQMRILTFKGLYDKIKEDMIAEYKAALNPPCTYFQDNNEVFKGNQTAVNQAQQIDLFLDALENAQIPCTDRAFTNTINWLETMSYECKESIGLMTTVIETSGGGNPNEPISSLEFNQVYTFSELDLQAAHNNGNPTTLAELFYAFSLETCLNETNPWGVFYNPDADDSSPDPVVAGENEYDAIQVILASLSMGTCGFTLPFGPEVASPPVQSCLNYTFTSPATQWINPVSATQIYNATELLLQVGFNDNNAHTNYTDFLSGSGGIVTIRRTYLTNKTNVPLGNGMTGDIYIKKIRHGVKVGNVITWSPLLPWEMKDIHWTVKNAGVCLYNSGHFDPLFGTSASEFEVVGAHLDVTDYAQLLGALLNETFGLRFTHSNGLTTTDHRVSYSNGCGGAGGSQDPFYTFDNCIPDFGIDLAFDLPDYVQDCIDLKLSQGEVDATWYYNQLLANLQSQFLASLNSCIANIKTEDFRMSYDLKEYQYTLYYYDLAGNLVQTVPPQGVDILTQGELDLLDEQDYTLPAHTMETRYEYNGLNSLISQYTPDGGQSTFYLDKLYRVRFSQNARQVAENKASYSKYDELGRVIEAGEFVLTNPQTNLTVYLPANVENNNFPSDNLRMDYTKTTYEDIYPNDPSIASIFNDGEQLNLRNAIGAIEHHQADYASNGSMISGSEIVTVSSYSYDPHKNVKQIVNSNYMLQADYATQKHKTVEYEYDLISGNVNKVHYQRNQRDEFNHMYHYDANNRLIRAFTSSNEDVWEMDAKYFYYLHGALARRELGENKVQGTDYAYNLQGWLKGVNSTTLNENRDLGKDGVTDPNPNSNNPSAHTGDNQFFGVDAFGFNLNYFEGDYESIDHELNIDKPFANTDFLRTENDNPSLYPNNHFGNLYNGNITHMVTAIRDLNQDKLDILGNIYWYDQLQRIKGMDVYEPSSQPNLETNNNFDNGGLYRLGAYRESYSYDKNGNIKTLKRRGSVQNAQGSALEMDNFVYKYYTDASMSSVTTTPENGNRLAAVVDNITASNYSTDIDPGQTDNNYLYDASGQLIKDLQEGIDKIEWTVTGKVKRITFAPSTGKHGLLFVYDPMDMRVAKIVYNNAEHTEYSATYYVHDAQGNPMSTYTTQNFEDGNSAGLKDKLYLSERYIYGSSRLGLEQVDKLMAYKQSDLTELDLGNPIVLASNSGPAGTWFKTDNVHPAFNEYVVFTPADYNRDGKSDVKISHDNSSSSFGAHVWSQLEPGQSATLEWDMLTTIPQILVLYAINEVGAIYTETWCNNAGHYSTTINVPTTSTGKTRLKFYTINQSVATEYIVSNFKMYGAVNPWNKELAPALPVEQEELIVGDKRYELSNHLGNVLAVVTDRKIPLNSTTYTADVIQYTDYSPFGVELDNRHGAEPTGRYRYSFQGQEHDDEIKGEGNSVNYKYRMHDPRIGRFFTVDPLSPKYPHNSPYAFSENSVIAFVELEGLEKASTEDKKQAEYALQNLEADIASGCQKDETKMPGVSLTDIIGELRTDINTPTDVFTNNVGGGYYCAKSSIQQEFLECNPEGYINFMVGLVVDGSVKINENLTINLTSETADANLSYHSYVDLAFGRSVYESTKDLSSIRTTANKLGYLNEEGNSIPQEMEMFLGIIGMHSYDHSYYRKEASWEIDFLARQVNAGFLPIVLENHMITHGQTRAEAMDASITWGIFGIHFIVIHKLERQSDGQISGEFFEYGEIKPFGPMSEDNFLEGMKGYWIPVNN